ncbi:amidase signature domain-containing protein [Calycina marina]|uniref:Amidase signature domain-containing protein n=1 Tax=Calycina marina TaxID=1763456 RepID=A0A9P8CD36_9HELO|nr:amidase signature domain-containing protein [Calycina marina]
MKLSFLSRVGFFAVVFTCVSSGFDSRENTIAGINNALNTGVFSCNNVVSFFLARYQHLIQLNAITLSSDALNIAYAMGILIASGNSRGALFCIPILPKDYNLHEVVLEGISVSSLGGQTTNPYDRTRTPGGSSGGIGAAIATNFAVFGTGIDTVNSLRSSASANSLFSFRPTPGLFKRGAIARNVRDLAVTLTVMVSSGYDAADNASALAPPSARGIDYSSELSGRELSGLIFGLIKGLFNLTVMPWPTLVLTLRAAGAAATSEKETVYNAIDIATLEVQTLEYREFTDACPKNSNVSNAASNPVNKLSIQNLTIVLDSTFSAGNFDALIYSEQKIFVFKLGSPSQSGPNGILTAMTGFPVVVVPAGLSPSPE